MVRNRLLKALRVSVPLGLLLGLVLIQALPVLGGLAEYRLGQQLDRWARQYGIELSWGSLHIDFDGVRIAQLRGRHSGVGEIYIEQLSADVDLLRLVTGELVIDRIRLDRPRLVLQYRLDARARTPRRAASATASLAGNRSSTPLFSEGSGDRIPGPISGPVIGCVEISDATVVGQIRSGRDRVEVRVHSLDLLVTRGLSSYFIEGFGEVASPYLAEENGLSVEGEALFDGTMAALDLQAIEPIKLRSPVADLALAGVGLKIHRGEIRVWLEQPELQAHLLDFTDTWRADWLLAGGQLGPRPGLRWLRLEGLDGEIDMNALSDFALWLDGGLASDNRALADLRLLASGALDELRRSMYASDLVVEASGGRIRLEQPDGSVHVVSTVELALGSAHSDTPGRIKLGYAGPREGDAETPSGGFRLSLDQLNAAAIAGWVR